MDIHAKRILILDFGSQYTQLIARMVRKLGVYCEIHAADISNQALRHFNPAGIILSGGPETVTDKRSLRAPADIFTMGCPILGICYGMQTMVEQLGGKVESTHTRREFGYAAVTLSKNLLPPDFNLFTGVEDRINTEGKALLDVWMSHGDQVTRLPPHFVGLAQTPHCEFAAIAHEKYPWYGLQFHPEVSHTPQGKRILERFLSEICHCESNWLPLNIIQEQIKAIRQTVGKEKVLLGLSGGVDSSVAAILLHKAIGEQLHCVFVDTGLLRLKESEHIEAVFGKHFGIQIRQVEASELFFEALRGIFDPEEKRKIIGKTFVQVFEAESQKIAGVKWLAQGTIYSDVIESAGAKTGKAHLIKSHHNVAGLPHTMSFKLIEPLRELFKDEVRQMGVELGLPVELVNRHPFPGPGLGVRVLGELKSTYVEKLRLADAILIDELHKTSLYEKVSQAFAVFLPVKSVGVVGDARQYDHVIAIRMVETIDFMTAKWAHVPYSFLEQVSTRIINEVPGISRVTYDISNKPPATIEWE